MANLTSVCSAESNAPRPTQTIHRILETPFGIILGYGRSGTRSSTLLLHTTGSSTSHTVHLPITFPGEPSIAVCHSTHTLHLRAKLRIICTIIHTQKRLGMGRRKEGRIGEHGAHWSVDSLELLVRRHSLYASFSESPLVGYSTIPWHCGFWAGYQSLLIGCNSTLCLTKAR